MDQILTLTCLKRNSCHSVICFLTLKASHSLKLSVMKSLTVGQKALHTQVIILVKLILVMPATNAVSERSFCALRRIKTFLRATMHQQRLNSIMILNVHQDKTDCLNVMSIANQFVSENERRLAIFGKFAV